MLPGITLESDSLTWVSPGKVDWLLGLDREGRRADVIRPIRFDPPSSAIRPNLPTVVVRITIISFFLCNLLPNYLERMNEQDGSDTLTVQRWTSRIAKMAQPDLDFIGRRGLFHQLNN